MKIKNVFLASLLSKMGVEAKAELVIDDSNGVTLTFPDISDIAEIAEGVAVDAPDGTYVIANGEDVWTLVVLAGAIVSATMEAPAVAEAVATELEAETQAVLEAITEQVVALKASNVNLVAEMADLKKSLKHDVEAPVVTPTANTKVPTFKMIG
jgi:hypothetical protein